MRYWTWSEIKAKVEADLGLEDEDFVSDTEMLAYANEAIDEAEAEIHEIHEDYFLQKTTPPLTLVSGTAEYDLPTDIYAMKIRSVIYANGSIVLPVKRLRDRSKFYNLATDALATSVPGVYEWFIYNPTAGTPKMVLTPTPREDGAYVTVWYLRNSNRLTVGADVCDIPEFVSFVIQYMKVRCYEKEGHPNLGLAVAALEQQRKQMSDTLTNLAVDNETEIEADFSAYDEMA